MADADRVKAKLQKLLALARQGVGGERDNAQSVLTKLLARHGMTIEDLDDASEERQIRYFRFKGQMERDLLGQCVFATLDATWDRSVWIRSRNERGYKLTNAEFAQVDLLFSIHRLAAAEFVKKQADIALLAYLTTNRLFSKNDQGGEAPPLSPEDIQSIVAMMRGLKPTPVHKALARAKPCDG